MVKLTVAEKSDYFFTADSGPGEENQTGLIVPKYGKNPEQHVSVILTWRQLNELLFTTVAHYNAWLSARYTADWAKYMRPVSMKKSGKEGRTTSTLHQHRKLRHANLALRSLRLYQRKPVLAAILAVFMPM